MIMLNKDVERLFHALVIIKDKSDAEDQLLIAGHQIKFLQEQLARRTFEFDFEIKVFSNNRREVRLFVTDKGIEVPNLGIAFVVKNDMKLSIGRFGDMLDEVAKNIHLMDSTAFKRSRLNKDEASDEEA